MHPGTMIAPGFRIQEALVAGEPERGLLVAEGRGGGRRRWVLKWIAERERLRPDLLDLASAQHPSLVLPCEFGRDPAGRRPFLLRPYIAGAGLVAALKGRTARSMVPWLHAAASALAMLHRLGFHHGNVKPSNFLVPARALAARPSRQTRVVLCDPASQAGVQGTASATSGDGAAHAARAADLEALGRAFHLLLTGAPARWREDGFPVPPSSLNPDLPVDLERVVVKLLDPDPARRYGATESLLEDLERLGRQRAPIRPAAPECLLGREAELRRVLGRIESMNPAAVAVTGEAGIGKSAFLRRLALEAQFLGYRTVRVRCYAESAAPAAPLLEIARQLARLDRSGRSPAAACRRLLAELGRYPDPGARRRFARGLIERFAAACAGSPVLILADDVHAADPISIELLAELMREIEAWSAAGAAAAPRPPSLALAWRSESPFRAALGPLAGTFAPSSGNPLLLELGPLAGESVERLLVLAGESEGLDGAPGPNRFRGNPLAVREAARAAAAPPLPLNEGLRSLHRRYLKSLPVEEAGILEMLAVLGRPARSDFLAAVLGCPRRKIDRASRSLLVAGDLVEEGGALFFRHGSSPEWLSGSLPESRRRKLHREIARRLERRRGESVEAVAHHWLLSDLPRRGIPAAIEAARSLAAGHADCRALDFFRHLLALLPGRVKIRRDLAVEAAEVHARSGEHREAIRLLQGLLVGSGRGLEAGKLHGRIGLYHHLAGETSRAVVHLEKGLALIGSGGHRALRERLRILSDLAEIATARGEHDRAESLCRRALEILEAAPGRRRDPEVRRQEVAILETLANLKLRRFEYEEARAIYERALNVGAGLGPAAELGLVLNNLGVLHNQQDRFPQAIACYERARRVATRLGQDSLRVSIDANLAVLHAKTGDPDAADLALRRAAIGDARCDSMRTRFLRLHASGMVNLLLGRCASAIEDFREAIGLGEELQDRHMLAFDLVYLGECHLLRGEWRASLAALDRAAAIEPAPPPIAALAAARRELLAALRGEDREFPAAEEDAIAGAAAGEANRTRAPYLDAWNQLHRGWACRLRGQVDGARRRLGAAADYFARCRVPAGEILARIELAALSLDCGDRRGAEKRLRALERRFRCGQGPLVNPMLAARLLLYRAKLLLEGEDADLRAVTAAVVEAEGYLIGRRHRDLEALARDLRRRVQLAGLTRGGDPPARPPAADPAPALDLVATLERSTSDLVRSLEEDLQADRADRALGRLRIFEKSLREVQRAVERRRPEGTEHPDAGAIVGRSAAARRLVEEVRRLARSELAVLITGETGTGKDLAARVLHSESPRRSGPFVSINCAALPEPLLEAELFGYRQGAFSGAAEDHEGLLAGARGGTFFFDEIGAMPPVLQAKLLRVLDRARVRPLGGADEVELDVRHLFSTNRDLAALVREGKFREDLFFRLGAAELRIPPLRERVEDLPLLAAQFRAACGLEGEGPELDAEALGALAAYPWPGNIRELKNVITRLVLTCRGRIAVRDVQLVLGDAPSGGLFSPALLRSRPLGQLAAQLEREYLLQLHRDHGGGLRAMIAALGITRRALYKRFRRLGIRPDELRRGANRAGPDPLRPA